MVLQLIGQAVSKKIAEKKLEKIIAKKALSKKTMRGLSVAFDNALKALNTELGDKEKISSVFELQKAIRSNRKIRNRFFTLLGEEMKKLGFRGDAKTLGKIGYKNIVRVKIAGEYSAALGAKGEDMVMRLQSLFDRTAKHFGMDPFTFYYKYNTNDGFRRIANTVLMREIRSDPVLSKNQKLLEMKPEEIMHSLASIKSSFIRRRDVLSYVLRQLPKRAPIEFLKASAMTVGSALQYMAMMPTMTVMQSVPHLSSMSFMMMYGVQHTASLYAQSYLSAANITKGVSPHLYMKYGMAQQMRKQMEEAEKAGLGVA